jgi:hypothetical protein
MKKNRNYRITSPTMAFASSNGDRTPTLVPVNAIVAISEDPREGDRLIDVVWNGKEYVMFTQDLRQRGERIE